MSAIASVLEKIWLHELTNNDVHSERTACTVIQILRRAGVRYGLLRGALNPQRVETTPE
jgi:hypothetical protein